MPVPTCSTFRSARSSYPCCRAPDVRPLSQCWARATFRGRLHGGPAASHGERDRHHAKRDSAGAQTTVGAAPQRADDVGSFHRAHAVRSSASSFTTDPSGRSSSGRGLFSADQTAGGVRLTSHETVASSCSSCGAALTLVCEPTQGFWGYPTYNEYFCPRCGKRNTVQSPGAVVSALLKETAATQP